MDSDRCVASRGSTAAVFWRWGKNLVCAFIICAAPGENSNQAFRLNIHLWDYPHSV